MKVHQIVDNSTLKIIFDLADDDLFSNIHDLEISQVGLFSVGVDGLVDLFIIADACAEIEGSGFRVLATIIRAGGLNIADVGHDKLFIIAFALHKESLYSMGVASLENPFSSFRGGICGIKDTDNTTGAEPVEHVGDGGLGGGPAFSLAFGVIGVEEVGGGLRGIVTPIVADVEGLSWDGEPLQVALSYPHKTC